MALGMVMQLPDGDQQSRSRRQLLAELDVCMGGRVAEELIFGSADITTGASSDLQKVGLSCCSLWMLAQPACHACPRRPHRLHTAFRQQAALQCCTCCTHKKQWASARRAC